MATAAHLFVHAAEEEEDLKLSFWEKSVNLRGALGYKDNVLLSNVNQERSGFWQSTAEFSLLRASLDEGPSVSLFATIEDRRYFSSPEVPNEDWVITQAKVSQDLSDQWAVGGLIQYLYAHQVFDASETEQLFVTLPVRSHNFQAAQFVVRKLPGDSELELKFTGERQLFNAPLDDYWELGPTLTYTKKYGYRSYASLSYTYDYRPYDTRNPLDLDRQLLPDLPLHFNQHEFEIIVNHVWDQERHWRTRSRALFEINKDNAFGFYDYDRYRFSQRIGYYGKDWQATVEGKVLYYDYQKQPVLDSGEVRQLWEYYLGFHVEKTVWKTLKIFADAEHEWVNSNFSLEEYRVNTVLGGVDWEF